MNTTTDDLARQSLDPDFEEDVHGVTVVRWNPSRPDDDGELRPVGNFGDLLGPLLVEMLSGKHLGPTRSDSPEGTSRLLAIGSILHFAKPSDVVWGSGINGKTVHRHAVPDDLDVRAVRGPITRRHLLRSGIDCPEVYGDPALLIPRYFPRLRAAAQHKTRTVAVIPNLNDLTRSPQDGRTISPLGELWSVLEAIAHSEFVVGSSLHAIVIAEALGIPARVIRSRTEPPTKYLDYYLGTGRDGIAAAENLDEALRLGGAEPIGTDFDALHAAFPSDLWSGTSIRRTPDDDRELTLLGAEVASTAPEHRATIAFGDAESGRRAARALQESSTRFDVIPDDQLPDAVLRAKLHTLRFIANASSSQAPLGTDDVHTVRRRALLARTANTAEADAAGSSEQGITLSGTTRAQIASSAPTTATLELNSQDGSVAAVLPVALTRLAQDGSISRWTTSEPLQLPTSDVAEAFTARLVWAGVDGDPVRVRLRASWLMAVRTTGTVRFDRTRAGLWVVHTTPRDSAADV